MPREPHRSAASPPGPAPAPGAGSRGARWRSDGSARTAVDLGGPCDTPRSVARPRRSGALGDDRLHAVHVTNTVLGTGNQAFLVAQDDPAAEGVAQLVWSEVMHDLVL